MKDVQDNKPGRVNGETMRRLSKKAMGPWLEDALIDWLVIGLVFVIMGATQNVFLLLPAILIIGNRQHALTVLGHEGAHFALSKSRRVNDTLSGLLAFWPLGLTTSGYRNVHMQHHKHTNMQEDPELAHRASRAPQWDLPIGLGRIAKYCASDLLGGSMADYRIIVTFSKPDKKSEYIPLAALHLGFVFITVATGLWWVAALWYLSLVTSFMMFFRLRTFLEHLGVPDTHRLRLNALQRHVLAPHNIWYHWEHHTYPAIAYRKLPELRRLLPQKPSITLQELLAFLAAAPQTASGQVLKSEQAVELRAAA
jgi:fatty acid desaturase